MWFDVNIYLVALSNLPLLQRKPLFVRFMFALVKPVNTVYYNWIQERSANLYKIEHTGQVCSLRKSLNDSFDAVERRIWIGNGQINETTIIYTEAEQLDEVIGNENEGVYVTLYTEPETGDTGYDFIVYVPEDVYETNLYGLRAHIDFYKAAGKRYAILIINE